MPIKTAAAPPPMTVTVARRIYEQVTAIFTIRTGVWAIGPWGAEQYAAQAVPSSTVSLGLNHANGWSVELTSAVVGQQVSATYSRTVLGGVKLATGGVVSSQGAVSVFVAGDRRLTENVRGGMTLDLGVSGTMTVKLR